MTPSRPNNEAIFHAAREIPDPDLRRDYVRQACTGDPARIAHVEALLAAADAPDSLLDRPAAREPVATIDQPLTEIPGTVIGPYKLIEQIGEGGMGTVWMAQQTEPVKRVVALKLIKAGMDSKQVIARFEAERQALAIMDHPNIAKIFDGGMASVEPSGRRVSDEPNTSGVPNTSGSRLDARQAGGLPYFVMELVKGVPITKYCDEHHLTPRQRLELFIPVCQAIQHAHQKGIIHRDLKPSNVLVALYDGSPVPKVIDFGVAKAAGQPLTEQTLVTGFGAIVGTLEYMSPEQAEVNQLDIDTRSDIYSLGVLLYELLAGSPPFTRKELEPGGMLEMLRVIREQEPSKPSTKLSTAEGLPTLAANRGTEPAKLRKLVRGELDWIVMKALEKDRNRRYETANVFAMDVQRYLADEPVLACPPSAGYRLRKFARRNKAALAFSGLILLILLAVTGGVGWNERDRAARRAAVEQEAILALNEAERWEEQGKWPEALSAAKRAEGLLAGGRSVELRGRVRQLRKDLEMVMRVEEIRLLMSDMKEDRFDYETADQAYAKAFTDYGIDVAGLPVEEAAAHIRARDKVASSLVAAIEDWAYARLQTDRAGALALRAVAMAAEQDPWRRRVQEAVTGKDTQALAALTASPDLFRQPPNSIVALERGMLAVDLKPAQIELLRRAQRRYPSDFWINHDLSSALAEMGDAYRDEVVSFQRAAVAIRPRSSEAHNLLGLALKAQGKQDEASEAYRKAIELDPKYSRPHVNLGDYFRQQEKLDDAVAAYLKAIEIDPKYAMAYGRLGTAFREQGKPEEAIAAFRKAIEFDPNKARFHNDLGAFLCDVKHDYDGAIAEFHKAIELDANHANAHRNLGIALERQGKGDEAIAEFQKAIEFDSKNAKAHCDLGASLCNVKHDYDGAIKEFFKAIELEPKNALAHHNLGIALKEQGKPEEAIAAYREAIKFDPKNAKVHSDLGAILCDVKHDYDAAIAEFREAIKLDSNDALAHHNLGVVLNLQKKHPEAVVALRKAIAIDSKFVHAYFQLGVALKAQGKLDDAIDAYHKAIAIAPKYPGAHYNLGIALHGQGKLDEAIDAYRKAVEIDPKHANAYCNLGNDLRDMKRLPEAVDAYHKAIAIDPKHSLAYHNLGIALRRQGKLDEAIDAYRKVIEIDPNNAKVYNNLGLALQAQGKLDEAIDAHRQSIKIDPNNAIAYNNLGVALEAQNKLDQAIAAYQEAIRLKADYILPHVTIAQLLTAGADPRFWDGKRAVELMNKVETLAGKTEESRRIMGLAHYRAGNWKESLAALEEAMKLTKDGDNSHWFCLAMVYQRLGNNPEARKCYDKAVEWMDKNKPKDEMGHLRRIRAEAAKLLGIADEVAPPPKEKK